MLAQVFGLADALGCGRVFLNKVWCRDSIVESVCGALALVRAIRKKRGSGRMGPATVEKGHYWRESACECRWSGEIPVPSVIAGKVLIGRERGNAMQRRDCKMRLWGC